MPEPTDFLTAVHNRVQSVKAGIDPDTSYDVIGIADGILSDGVPLSEVDEQTFLRMMCRHVVEDQTEIPCPDWCSRGAGHPFESQFPDGRQSRPHERKLPRPDIAGEVYLSLLQQEDRQQGDDSTVVRHATVVSFAVDGDFRADELGALAAVLLNAVDELDKVTDGGDQWTTEDKL